MTFVLQNPGKVNIIFEPTQNVKYLSIRYDRKGKLHLTSVNLVQKQRPDVFACCKCIGKLLTRAYAWGSPSIISEDISRGSIIIILRHQNLSLFSSL